MSIRQPTSLHEARDILPRSARPPRPSAAGLLALALAGLLGGAAAQEPPAGATMGGPAVVEVTALPGEPPAGLPVIGIHYHDLPPGGASEVDVALPTPALPRIEALKITSYGVCLELGQLFKPVESDLWHLRVALAGEEPCRTSIVLTADDGAREWQGEILLAFNPVQGYQPLPNAGELLDVGLSARPVHLPDTLFDPNGTPYFELAFDNLASEPITLLSLSHSQALHDLLGPAYRLVPDDEGEHVRHEVASQEGVGLQPTVLLPGESELLGVPMDAGGRLVDGYSVVTLFLLPIVEYGGEQYYVDLPGITVYPSMEEE